MNHGHVAILSGVDEKRVLNCHGNYSPVKNQRRTRIPQADLFFERKLVRPDQNYRKKNWSTQTGFGSDIFSSDKNTAKRVPVG